jgi:thioredoxin reductase
MSVQTPLLIIGAGPFGLAMGAYARRIGIESLVVGEPMSFWKSNMPAGMFLRSGVDWHLDAAGEWTIARFLVDQGIPHEAIEPFPLSTYLDYVDWFARQASVDVVRSMVSRLDREGDAFAATLADGRIVRASAVIVAVGFQRFPHIPRELATMLPADRTEHTCTAVQFAPLAGQRCLIVGGRQSAFEWAALIAEAGAASVDVVYRHETPRFTDSQWEWAGELVQRFVDDPGWYRRMTQEERDTVAHRFWAEGRLKLEPWLEPRLRAGNVRMHPRTEVRAAAAGHGAVRVTLTSGEEVSVDRVILATGYKPSLAQVPFLSAGNLIETIEATNGNPVLDDAMQSSVPGLFFTSMLATATFGPFFAFTVSARASAQIIGRAVRGRTT